MFYDPRSDSHGLPHNPWTALVTPRPIGWISSRAADGTANLAPYSFFNAVSGNPPMVAFSSSTLKDTLANIEATREFAVNIATWDLREAMNFSSSPLPPDKDELAFAELEKADCRNIAAPRVAASPIVLECILNRCVPLTPQSGLPCTATLVIGEVVGIHINESILANSLVDIARLRPLSRLGYMDYAVIYETFEMCRPV